MKVIPLIMKKTLLLTALAVFTFGLVSCQKDNFGYEKTVHFTAEGGELSIDGNESVNTLEITDYNGKGVEGHENYIDEIIAQYEWLTVRKSKITEPKMIFFKAEPNTSGKSRTLYVRGMVRDTHAEIKVVQDK